MEKPNARVAVIGPDFRKSCVALPRLVPAHVELWTPFAF
jgi:hypothetical protein